ncbi:dystroglycan 1-like isoform X2 [Lagenorhynchus albirostris]|uniref:dystroglycan 1-like isoform X2 n=1 Tax=Lagenorhynchus albirostris TaxID=27610 RepID=UPI0028E2425A|nr:dystroglycan 1-like isoform X2 [Lagenorhynchus albirostris]
MSPPGQPNTSPTVVNPIQLITATVGHRLHFPIHPDTFYDQEDGSSTHLTLAIKSVDEYPSGSESWLQFNLTHQILYGYPLELDFQYSPQEFILHATDSGGLAAQMLFTIELKLPRSTPCHTYTLRTKNSFYSFIKKRERISLFFAKLTDYLNSSSPEQIVLTTLRPGSTIISWYNRTLCEVNGSSLKRCPNRKIQEVMFKLRRPDGNVHPDFAYAMSPEYKIGTIENITYGGICLILEPDNGSVIENSILASSNIENTHWIRNLILALLSLVFQGRTLISNSDQEMYVLRPRKPPILECEVPPSAGLWRGTPLSSQHQPYRENVTSATDTRVVNLPAFKTSTPIP